MPESWQSLPQHRLRLLPSKRFDPAADGGIIETDDAGSEQTGIFCARFPDGESAYGNSGRHLRDR